MMRKKTSGKRPARSIIVRAVPRDRRRALACFDGRIEPAAIGAKRHHQPEA
jgi:hypothetical protein